MNPKQGVPNNADLALAEYNQQVSLQKQTPQKLKPSKTKIKLKHDQNIFFSDHLFFFSELSKQF